MGLNIGAAARAVSALPPTGLNRPDRAAVPRDPEADRRGDLVQRPEEPEIRAGFGENTLSPNGAALETLDSNLEVAGRLVPTVEELRQRAQVNQAQRADAVETRTARTPDVRRRETVRPEPNPAVRNFATEPRPESVQNPQLQETDRVSGNRAENPLPQPANDRIDIRI